MTPLGMANDRLRQIGGRYRDDTGYDYMMRMGVWTENLSLPAVLNECLMQSYTGVIRLFPNTQGMGKAAFRDLRAAGAFLVSASWDGKVVADVRITSERAAPVRLLNPWPGSRVEVRRMAGGEVVVHEVRDGVIQFPTELATGYSVRPT